MKRYIKCGYEVMRYAYDPYAGEEIVLWEPATIDDLQEIHQDQIDIDAHLPEFEKSAMLQDGSWYDTEEDFDEWLAKAISDGYVRRT